tara:strand:+ start:997 stop:1236 length:240 start_codon:yes stop_codon:yes gene_type:complete
MTQPSLEAKTLQVLVDEQRKLNRGIQDLLDQDEQKSEEKPMRELLEELILGREEDRELMSKIVAQQNQFIQFLERLGTG